MDEIWKPIPEYEGIYEASNLGRIRSTEGKTTYSVRHGERHWKSRIIKPKSEKAGRADLRVCLWKDKTPRWFLVSRLVAMAFKGIPQQGMTVDHVNGDFLDNRIENLEWVTRAENIRRGFAIGLYESIKKKVMLKNTETGESILFSSYSDCERFLGKQHGYVSSRIKKGRNFDGKYSFEKVD